MDTTVAHRTRHEDCGTGDSVGSMSNREDRYHPGAG